MKRTLFLDFDNVIVDTVAAVCAVYRHEYYGHPEYKDPESSRVWRYDMLDECPLIGSDRQWVFEHPNLYIGFGREETCGFFDPHTRDKLELLSAGFDVVICTLGTRKNLRLKQDWLRKHAPFIKEGIFIQSERYYGKQVINMAGGYFVDDGEKNLATSNALVNICFGRTAEWNEKWQGKRAQNWTDLSLQLAVLQWNEDVAAQAAASMME